MAELANCLRASSAWGDRKSEDREKLCRILWNRQHAEYTLYAMHQY